VGAPCRTSSREIAEDRGGEGHQGTEPGHQACRGADQQAGGQITVTVDGVQRAGMTTTPELVPVR